MGKMPKDVILVKAPKDRAKLKQYKCENPGCKETRSSFANLKRLNGLNLCSKCYNNQERVFYPWEKYPSGYWLPFSSNQRKRFVRDTTRLSLRWAITDTPKVLE
jgi:hypothetical protein